MEKMLKIMVDSVGLDSFGGRKAVRRARVERKLFRPLPSTHPQLLQQFEKSGEDSWDSYYLLSCSSENEAKQLMVALGYAVDAHRMGVGCHYWNEMTFKVVGANRVLAHQHNAMDV